MQLSKLYIGTSGRILYQFICDSGNIGLAVFTGTVRDGKLLFKHFYS